MSSKAATVSALVRYLKGKLENDTLLQKVLVEGEISNFSSYRSGHWYFSLKDAYAQIKCVMFASSNRRVGFMPKDGDKVFVQADLSVYEARGEIQLIVTAMRPFGVGELYLKYEMLKKKLEAEGLFDEAHNKPIPRYPFRIALVTGRNTDARMDVLTTLGRRWPCAEITEYPVLVQGNESASQIISALLKCDQEDHDIVLLVRGGGSIEDLWSFNDERLAHVIYDMQTPLITGIGHEPDFTIADYVADLRAPTPTGAAERCSPDIKNVLTVIQTARDRMTNTIYQDLDAYDYQLKTLKNAPVFRTPERLYAQKAMKLEHLHTSLMHMIDQRMTDTSARVKDGHNRIMNASVQMIRSRQNELTGYRTAIDHAMTIMMNDSESRFRRTAALLDAYSPLKILGRGYSVTLKDGKAVTDCGQVSTGDRIETLVAEGRIISEVTGVKPKENI